MAFALVLFTTGCGGASLDPVEASVLDSLQRGNLERLDELTASHLERTPGELSPVFLKVAFPVGRHGVATEWMWVNLETWDPWHLFCDEGDLQGVLANEPRRRTDISNGSTVCFARDRVADYQEGLGDGAPGNALRRMIHGGLYSPDVGGNIPASAPP